MERFTKYHCFSILPTATSSIVFVAFCNTFSTLYIQEVLRFLHLPRYDICFSKLQNRALQEATQIMQTGLCLPSVPQCQRQKKIPYGLSIQVNLIKKITKEKIGSWQLCQFDFEVESWTCQLSVISYWLFTLYNDIISIACHCTSLMQCINLLMKGNKMEATELYCIIKLHSLNVWFFPS